MAEGMEADDPFASIIQFCQPTASQLAMFPTCPFHRDSDELQDPNPDPDPDTFPCYSDRIVSNSLTLSQNSAGNQAEDSAVFHTPPENDFQSNLSSSEDQNPNELCAEGARVVDLGGGADVSKKAKGFEEVLDDELGSKKTRVPGAESDGERSEEIGDEIEGTDAVDEEIIDSGHGDTDEETMGVDLAEESRDTIEIVVAGIVQKTTVLNKHFASIVDAIDANHELGNKCDDEPIGDITVDEGKRPCESSDITENLAGGEAEDEIVKLKHLFSSKLGEVARESGNEGTSKDGNGNKGWRTACRRIEDIDEFRFFTGWVDAVRELKPQEPDVSIPSKRKRELPATMKEMGKNERVLIKGKEKNDGRSNETGIRDIKSGGLNLGKEKNDGGTNMAGMTETEVGKSNKYKEMNAQGSNVAGMAVPKSGEINTGKEKSNGRNNVAGKAEVKSGQSNNEGGINVAGKLEKGGLFAFLDMLKTIVKNLNDANGGADPVDFLETAKKRGMTFPRSRWRPPDGKEM